LPSGLRQLARQSRGHRSRLNAPLLIPFLDWLESLGLEPNLLHGRPQEWKRQRSPVHQRGAKATCDNVFSTCGKHLRRHASKGCSTCSKC
jgi:hypothetical protein